MIDLKELRQNPEAYRVRLATRLGGDMALLDKVVALDQKARSMRQEAEAARAEHKAFSAQFGLLKLRGDEESRVAALEAEVVALDARLSRLLEAMEKLLTPICGS